MPDFWALKFATWVASLHSLNWCKTGLLSTKPVAFASEPIRDQPADFQTVAQSHPYTVILQVTKSGLDVVTVNNDWCHMKVGCLVNICMLKVSCRFDLTPLLELQIHSDAGKDRSNTALPPRRRSSQEEEIQCFLVQPRITWESFTLRVHTTLKKKLTSGYD